MSKNETEEKNSILIRTSWISTIGNALLSLMKIVTGVFSGSFAVLSDGIDSATDVVISIVMIFTARIVSRPPDKTHVYGYEKAEGIATKILSLVVVFAGMQLFATSFKSIFSSVQRELPRVLAIYITVISIIGKFFLALYQFNKGKKANSPMLVANAKNMRNDVLISVSVLIGLLFTYGLKLPILDAITGVLVSLFIIRTGIGIFLDSDEELMDAVKDTSIYEKIFGAVEMVSGVSNPHRVRVRPIGGMYVISMDVEVDGHLSILEGHDLVNKVESNIRNVIDNVYDIRIHIEPKGVQHHPENFGLEKEDVLE